MKSPSSDLYELVQSLTKSEKRYIRLQSGKGGKEYLKLLDALLDMKEYDESALVREHKGESFVKHLPVYKRYLFHFILGQLEQYRQQKTGDKVREGIQFARILLSRNMYEAAGKQLKKSKKKAKRFGLYRNLLEVLEVEKQLLTSFPGRENRPDMVDQLYREEKDCLEKILNINEYWRLNKRMSYLQMQYQQRPDPEGKKQLLGLKEHPLLSNSKSAITLESQVYYFQTLAIFYFTTGATEEAATYNQRLLKLLEKEPDYLERFPERYLATLNNYLIDNLMMRRYLPLDEGLKKLRGLATQKAFRKLRNVKLRIFQQSYLLEINRCLTTGEMERAISLIPEVTKGLSIYQKEMAGHNRLTFHYLLAYLNFLDSNFSKALEWVNKLLQDSKEEVVLEVHHFSRILNLLIHFELGNYELLSSLLINTRRYLRQRRKIFDTEVALFRYLQKQINSADNQESKKLKTAFRKEVTALKEKPEEAHFFNYIDLTKWV